MNTEELERFGELIQKAHTLGDANPEHYRQRVVALALLGPALFISAAILFLGLTIGAVVSLVGGHLLIGTLLILLAGLLLRMFWVRLPPPTGHRLNAQKYPRLFGEIDEICGKLIIKRVDDVRLGNGFGIEVVETPLFGALPLHRISVVIGLPLLTAFASTEAGALLARELAHVSSHCGPIHRMVMASRSIAMRLMETLEGEEGLFSTPLRRFFEWYAPRLYAYSLALVHRYELEADAAAAEASSVDAVALALVTRAVKQSAAAELFWQPLWARANDEPEPVTDAWSQLAQFHRDFNATREQILALIAQTSSGEEGNPEPPLGERLERLRAKLRLPREFRHSAAEKFLGERYRPWLAKLDEEWAEDNLTEWQERYIDTQNAQARMLDLGLTGADELSNDELWELATLTERLKSAEDALGHYWAWHKRNPSSPQGELALGRSLLARGDARGLQFLEHAAEVPSLLLEASQLAVAYLEQTGKEVQVRVWRGRAQAQAEQAQAAERERASVRTTDTFEPPQLSNEQVRELKLALSSVPGLEEAHIARKRLNHFPEQPLYVLACKIAGSHNERMRHQILERTRSLNGETRVLFTRGAESGAAEKTRRVGEKVLSL